MSLMTSYNYDLDAVAEDFERSAREEAILVVGPCPPLFDADGVESAAYDEWWQEYKRVFAETLRGLYGEQGR